MKTTTLLTTTFISLLIAGQSAIAGEDVERDEYSIGITWDDGSLPTNTNRINYSLGSVNTDFSTFIGEGAERDEYSIGLVWSDETLSGTSRVNYAAPKMSAEDIALDAELFPNHNR